MRIHIVTDSAGDIPQAVLDNLPISVVPVYITLNGKSYQDNVDLTREEFYAALPNADTHPTTAAPSPAQYIQVYDQLVDQGASAIISIHISQTLSTVFHSVEAAAKEFDRVPVYPVDSGSLSMGLGLIVIKAAQAVKAGRSLDDVRKIIDDSILRAHAFAKLDTIDYLLRGGRMSAIQYNVVSLLGIKPILKMNNHVSRMEIARTKRKAYEKVLNVALDKYPRSELFGITHANAIDQVNDLMQSLRQNYPDLSKPYVAAVTPALGAHVGPGSLCVSWIERKPAEGQQRKGLRKWLPQ